MIDFKKRYGINIDILLAVVLVLHDIGKPIPETNSKQLITTIPILRALFKRLSFSDFEIKLACTLVNNDVFGNLLRGFIGPKKGATKLRKSAKKLGIKQQDYISLRTLYYLCDAYSYECIRSNINRKMFLSDKGRSLGEKSSPYIVMRTVLDSDYSYKKDPLYFYHRVLVEKSKK